MIINLSGFKVVYNEVVWKALALINIHMGPETEGINTESCFRGKPKFIEIAVINADGNIEFIRDEAWRFQFIPIITE